MKGICALVHCESWTLRSQKTAEAFSTQLSGKLRRYPSYLRDIGQTYPSTCALLRKQFLVSSAYPNEKKRYDEVYREAGEAKSAAYEKTLLSASTRAIVGNYRENRRTDAFSDSRRGSGKGVSVKKSRCTDVGMMLENSIKKFSV